MFDSVVFNAGTRRRRALLLVGGVAVAVMLASPAGAQALTPTITEYPIGGSPEVIAIAAGPDGNLWFTDATNKKLGRINPTTKAIDEFGTGLNAGANLDGIAPGPDGNLWFTDFGSPEAVGRINPTSQAINEFNFSSGHFMEEGVAGGPDGNVWFTDDSSPGQIGRVTPGGTINEFSAGLNSGSAPLNGMALGSDGNMWFTDVGTTKAIGRINPTTQAITEFDHSNGLNSGSDPSGGIVAGPDGNLWFADNGSTKAIGRITPSGAISEFSAGLATSSGTGALAAGPDGDIWFADYGKPAIGRIDPVTQAIDEFSSGLPAGSQPEWIALGSDGNMWFVDQDTGAVGRITTPPTATTTGATATGPTSWTVSGTANGHAQTTSFHVEYGPVGGSTTNTPEQSLGTTSGDTPASTMLTGLTVNTKYQARVVVTNPTDTTAGEFLTFTTGAAPGSTVTAPTATKDSIRNFAIKPSTFKAANGGGPLVAARRRGAIVSYTGTQPATTTFTVQRPTAGRRQGHACVKQTKRNRKHKRCTRWVNVGSFTHADTLGANRFRFTGRIHGRKLKPGKYRLRAIPRNSAGLGAAVTRMFRVKKK